MRLAPATFNNRNKYLSFLWICLYLLTGIVLLMGKKEQIVLYRLGFMNSSLLVPYISSLHRVAHVLLYGKLIKLQLEAVRSKYQIHQMRCAWKYYFIYVMNVAPILKVLVGKAFNMMGLLPKADLAYAAGRPIKLFSFFKQTCTQKERERDTYSSIPTFSFWIEIKHNKLDGSKNFL